MDDKLFELMTQIYGEVTQLKEKVSSIRLSQLRVENELVPRVKAALDGYGQIFEKQIEHDKRFDDIEEKIEKHDVEIRVVKKDKAG